MHENVEIWLIRHGETEWSLSGAHTSRSDIPLTERGSGQARAMRDYLQSLKFMRVLTSPMRRARETCRIAGFEAAAQVREELKEWDYGRYEGRTTSDIRAENAGWSIWQSDPPGGEPLTAVAARAASVIDDCLASGGRTALFSHAHFLRVLAAMWVGLPPRAGRLFALQTGTVSSLGFERENKVIRTWNRIFE